MIKTNALSDEIADRLKAARAARYPTAAAAARALNLNPFTVRAHESGQNGIPDHLLTKYCDAYGISLAWLIRGTDEPLTREVPLVGELHSGSFKRKVSAVSDLGSVPVFVPGYESGCLTVFRDLSPNLNTNFAHFVVIASDTDTVHLIYPSLFDEVVVEREISNLVETAIWKIGFSGDGLSIYNGVSIETSDEVISFDKDVAKRSFSLLGVVVARYSLHFAAARAKRITHPLTRDYAREKI